MQRRGFLKFAAAALALLPLRALAAIWNKPAFDSTATAGALQGLGIAGSTPSDAIDLVAPQLAENGAIVQIEVRSRVPDTDAIAILVEKNPTPLIANFMFSNGAEPYVITRIKMAESSDLTAIVRAGGKYYSTSRKVEVALGGCG